LVTGDWRTFRPWSGTINYKVGDAGREAEAKPAPPLIPHRFIDGKISWEKRSEHIFSYVKLKTGWEIIAANTAGDPNQCQGFKADLVHVDEDTSTPGWYTEMIGRCSIRDGKLRWTALPHSKNDELMNLLERAEDAADEPEPNSVLIRATVYDNPYIPEKSRKANEKMWKSEGEDVYRQRALGEVNVGHILMYPNFSVDTHEAMKETEPRLPVQEALFKNNGVPPLDWMRIMSVDPGHTVCAVGFFAVPPPEKFGDHIVLYNLLYITNCDASVFGDEVKKVFAEEHTIFQRFVIDSHGANLRELGSGVLPRKQYSDQLKKHGIKSVDTGHGFADGCDDIKGREGIFREFLRIRSDGTTKFLVVTSKCAMFVREIKRFKKKTIKRGSGMEVILDEGNRRVHTHAIEAVEMVVAGKIAYIKPGKSVMKETWVDRILKDRQHRDLQRAANYYGTKGRTIELGPRGSG
jgi:hypothetical protein